MTQTTFWKDLWHQGDTPWDLGGAHSSLERAMELLQGFRPLSLGSSIWVPGCGRGHEARALASLGFDVLANDIEPKAIEAARKLGEGEGLTLEVGDALESQNRLFDAVFDRAFLCALPESVRLKYVENLIKHLKEGGFFVGLLFGEVAVEQGPPFGVTEWEVFDYFSQDGNLVAVEMIPRWNHTGNVKKEYIFVWQKNSKELS